MGSFVQTLLSDNRAMGRLFGCCMGRLGVTRVIRLGKSVRTIRPKFLTHLSFQLVGIWLANAPGKGLMDVGLRLKRRKNIRIGTCCFQPPNN